ncbi:MAG: hypothetical protein L0216_14005 [Planctomycetales bacterium]|nr:hypothetical protein [Planctomycetales bacterium]
MANALAGLVIALLLQQAAPAPPQPSAAIVAPVAGKLVDGAHANGMTYHIRAPATFDPKKPLPAIVILHGSNMNSRAYVDTIVSAWPEIAEDYLLIGLNGERRSPASRTDDPRYNYTYVNFGGRSKYPGTNKNESPRYVEEVLRDMKAALPITKIFVGGHSQGGFLTYMIFMNYPELVAGAFPISAGVIIQAEPVAFVDPEIRAAQRRIPIAVVHGMNDPTVAFSQGESSYESFEDDSFPMLRLFKDRMAGHMFALLPVDDAIRWLEAMTSESPAALASLAEKSIGEGKFRDALAAIARAREQDKDGKLKGKLADLSGRVERLVVPRAKTYLKAIQAARDGAWVDDFLEFRKHFEFADAAKEVVAAYKALRETHEKPAEELFWPARQDFMQKRKKEGREKLAEIVRKYYASSWYRVAKRWLEEDE